MIKKIVLGTLLVGLIGILVAGAIIRTVDKTGNVAEARGQGNGRGYSGESEGLAETPGQGFGADTQSRGRGGYGQGGGQGQSAGSAERQYPNFEAAPEDRVVVEGTVVQAPGAGVDLVIETGDGEEVPVGTGPGYMGAQGFTLQAGEQVQVQGYWEDDELKAAQVTRLQDGQTIALRDEAGRPAWAGGGKRVTERQDLEAPSSGDQGRGQGGYGGEGRTDAPGDGTGTGQAQVDGWLMVEGVVTGVDGDALLVRTVDGEEITVEGRPWRFAQEQGFWAQVDDKVTLIGFYEGDDFEVGSIDDAANGQIVRIREENGRPLWAGRGRRGG
jgi:hypothetical protein